MYKVQEYKGTTYNPKIKFDNKVKPYQEKKYDKVHTYDKIRNYDNVREYKMTLTDIPKYKEYIPPWSRDKEPYQGPKPKTKPKSKPAPAPLKVPKEKETPYVSSVGCIKRSFDVYGLDF